jgi:NAD+ diphosphatase
VAGPITFSGNPLDRASQRRREPAWISARLDDPATRFLPLWKLHALVKRRSTPAIAWARGEVRASMDPDVGPVLLGLREGIAHFAVDVSPLAEPEQALGVSGVAKFEEPRAIAALLPAGEGGILAQARSLVDWHARHRFCSTCGERTHSGDGGYLRACPGCSAQHFPRTDPVVIMLVQRGDACLLGRQAAWPPRMYSALAGFVEPGETLEEAVRREVLEEAGIEVAAVRYHSSQPWPFPASLMIGCLAEAASDAIRIDPGELAEARWFSRGEVQKALAAQTGTSDLLVPPPMAIAHHLIRAFADAA